MQACDQGIRGRARACGGLVMSEVTGSPKGARARTVIFLSVVANAAQDVGEPAVRPSAAESLRLATALGHRRRETRSIKVTATDGQPQLQRLIPQRRRSPRSAGGTQP
jgi:hypothetical protein